MDSDPALESSQPLSPNARRATMAAFVGTFIEYYDFALYGTLTVYLAPSFFPSDDPAASLLATLAVFGAGFVVRPIGGLVFGRIGDRQGRRAALLASVLLMAVCSSLIAVLPTFGAVGVLAPLLLVLLRLGQGLSAGSEMLGSVTFVIESAPPSRRTLLASAAPFGSVLGGLASSAFVTVLASVLPEDAMGSYGWRIAFLTAIPLGVTAFLLRRKAEDSPEFRKAKNTTGVVKSPLRESVRVHWRLLLIAGGIAIGANGVAGMASWFPTYLAGNRELPMESVLLMFTISGVLASSLVLLAGSVSDHFGRPRVMCALLGMFCVAIIPVLLIMTTSTNWLLLGCAMFLFTALSNLLIAPAFTHIAQMFPLNVRYTASNIGQNIGTVLGSGIAPMVAGALLMATGSGLGPAVWIVGACSIALLALLFERRMHRSVPFSPAYALGLSADTSTDLDTAVVGESDDGKNVPRTSDDDQGIGTANQYRVAGISHVGGDEH